MTVAPPTAALVLMTDFGVQDGAVAAMKGVALGTHPGLPLVDLTHEIPPFNIREAAFRLRQTTPYWAPGTVFVTVVDPGVGTERRSLVARSGRGQLFVGPDNGLLTLIERDDGLSDVRAVDETLHRLPGSASSYTFLGRDLYAYLGARLAGGQLTLEQVGPPAPPPLRFELRAPVRHSDGSVEGGIPVLDHRFGNVWTDLGPAELGALGLREGDRLLITVRLHGVERYREELPFVHSFGWVAPGERLAYLNSLLQLALAVNGGSFAQSFGVASGEGWSVQVRRAGG